MNTLGEVKHTPRGFEIIEFADRYGVKCSLQQSSLAEYTEPGSSAIWFGIDDAQPKVLASEAASVGVKTDETVGWVEYPIPENVQLRTRMHLDRPRVEALIEHLQCWLKDNTFAPSPERT